MGNLIRCGRKTHPSVPQDNSEHDAVQETYPKLAKNVDLCVIKWSEYIPCDNKDGILPFLPEWAKPMDETCMQNDSVTSKKRGKFMRFLCPARRPEKVNDRADDSNSKARLPERCPERSVQVIPSTPNILHKCVRFESLQLIPLFVHEELDIDKMDSSGQTALHIASEMLTKPTIQMLLRCGANVNLKVPMTGQSALHLAVKSSSTKSDITLAAGAECVKELLQNGAQVSMRDTYGKEAIHFACQGGREDLVSLLLDYGADINSLTRMEESPLFVFLNEKKNLRNTPLLDTLLFLSYPLKITNENNQLPAGLIFPHAAPLKDTLLRMTSEVLSLQDICKFNIRKIFGGLMKLRMKMQLPADLYKSIYIDQEFSYASKIKHLG